ncbi:MAG: hypothetical protein AAF433_15400 [Bacteroidota bacterium]
MKNSTLFRFTCIVLFSLSLGCYAYLNHLKSTQSETEVQEVSVDAVDVGADALESGATMLIQKAIIGTRNLLAQ